MGTAKPMHIITSQMPPAAAAVASQLEPVMAEYDWGVLGRVYDTALEELASSIP